MIANILSIAGSDPSGGAGIQADLKTFAACGTYGMAAVTALTAQNTLGVSGLHLVPADFVAAQIAAVFSDVRVDAVKIGMIATADIADSVAKSLSVRHAAPIVLDPVMIAKGGSNLLAPAAVDTLRRKLVPLATLLTPNLPEAAALLGGSAATSRKQMQSQAEALLDLGAQAVLLKGGHLDGKDSPDVLVSAGHAEWFDAPRHPTSNTHGTGCTLSAALAAELGKGASLSDAVRSAKTYLTGAVRRADELDVGSGHGPTHHFHALWAATLPKKD